MNAADGIYERNNLKRRDARRVHIKIVSGFQDESFLMLGVVDYVKKGSIYAE